MKYIDSVNIRQGTASKHRFSNGNTLPLVQLPFAMLGFAAQTQNIGGWFFHPDDRCLEGVRLTHQPSPWIGDYGSFLFSPQTDRIFDDPERGWTGYKPEDAVMTPAYLKLEFLRSRTIFELAPAQRGCKIKLTYPQGRKPYFTVYPVYGNYEYNLDTEKGILYASCDGVRGDFAKNFKNYTVFKFNCSVDSNNSYKGEENCFHIAFDSLNVEIDVASSYISFDQAVVNMRRELSLKTFDQLRSDAENEWEDYLSKIKIETDDDNQFRTFYSCLYRTGLFPHKAFEIDKEGNKVHYCPFDGTVKPGIRYTDNGFWDTYRTEYPLLALIAKDKYAEFLEGFIADYKDGGWLPRWPSIGERGCMPSTLIDAVIADAAVKGIINGELLETAFEGMLNHANNDAPDEDLGRTGAGSYLKYGYVPKDEVKRSSVNLTLDAAYGDYCIAQVAKILGKNDIADVYLLRSKNYKNLFDPQTGFMRGRYTSGEFDKSFDCFDWGGDYTEGSAWQSSFAVPHDIEGLAGLYGGKDNLIKKLDELFAAPPLYNIGSYGCEIHEITEMAAADFGQCAISNQPSFHLPYMFAALGDTKKTEYWVEKICKKAFSAENDGFPGDEDNGSMSAWYILSTLGIYDICPGKNEYIKIKKLCKKAEILGKEI